MILFKPCKNTIQDVSEIVSPVYEALTTEQYRKVNTDNKFARGFVEHLMTEYPILCKMLIDNHIKFSGEHDFQFGDTDVHSEFAAVIITQESCKNYEVLPVVCRIIGRIGIKFMKELLCYPEGADNFCAETDKVVRQNNKLQSAIIFSRADHNNCHDVLYVKDDVSQKQEYTGTLEYDMHLFEQTAYRNGKCLFEPVDMPGLSNKILEVLS